MGADSYRLQQNDADSQVWMIVKKPLCGRVGKPPDSSGGTEELLGLLCVYVDDFLVMAPAGPVREAAVKALTSLWEFGAERTLTPRPL